VTMTNMLNSHKLFSAPAQSAGAVPCRTGLATWYEADRFTALARRCAR
jgi:hypothetical protein